jgi:hypothetical protein
MARSKGIGSRALRAAVSGAVNALIWLYLPKLYLTTLGPAFGISQPQGLLLSLGLVITFAQMTAAFLQGTLASALLGLAAYLGSAYLTYLLANGGVLALSFMALRLEVNFKPLLWLLLLPLLYNAARAPLLYALDQRKDRRAMRP